MARKNKPRTKKITSPVPYFPGHVIISDPLNLDQVIAMQDALEDANEFSTVTDKGEIEIEKPIKYYRALFIGVIACIEAFNIDGYGPGVTVKTFPATPIGPATDLLSWLIGEVTTLFKEAQAPVKK